jgi:glycosyltransferase involved in cell wall biosynthesis
MTGMKHGQTTLIWLHSHFKNWMGGTKFIYEVTKRLKKDHNVIVIVENSSQSSKRKYKDENINLISLNSLTSNNYIYWLLLPYFIVKDFILIKKIIKNIQKKHSNIVIISSMFPMNVVARLLNLKHIQYCFEPFTFFHDQSFISKFPALKLLLIRLLGFIWKPLDIWATRKSDRVITLNKSTSKHIKKIYGLVPDISLAGIDTNHFKPYVSKTILNKYKNKKIIAHSTDYSPVKGTDLMIRLFAKVKKDIPNAHLLITSTIKNTKAESDLKKLSRRLKIENSIEFLGFVDYRILPQIYSLAKVFVQCSSSLESGTTSMALPVKEAMACQTLAIRFPISEEDVVDNATGYLVNPQNTPKMVSTIIKVLNMKKKMYNVMTKSARNFIKNNYTWENTCNNVVYSISKS